MKSFKFTACFFVVLAAVSLAVGGARAQTMVRGQASDPVHGQALDPLHGQAIEVPRAQPVEPAQRALPVEPMSASSSAVYTLAPDDVVEVHVYQEDDLLTTARISQDGTITFPLIGSVRIGGKTADAAAQVIGAELAKDYLVSPQVTMKIIEYAQRRYTVLGQVGKPGTYAMPDRDSITLLEAVGNAGGFTRIADLGNIRLKRLESGHETLYKLSAKGMTTRQTSTFTIKPGDIITVGESFF